MNHLAPVTTLFSGWFEIMKTILAILIGFALNASAQTNQVSTNALAKKSTKQQPAVVTKEMVMQGIGTYTKQISELKAAQVARKKQYDAACENLDLAFASGKIPSDPNVFGGGKQRYQESIRQKYAMESDQIEKQFATVSLQRIQLCQRYGIPVPKD